MQKVRFFRNSFLFILLNFLIVQSGFNQERRTLLRLDSLAQRVKTENGAAEAKTLNQLALRYASVNSKKSLFYALQYIRVSDSLSSKAEKVTFLKKLSEKLAERNEYKNSYLLLQLRDSLKQLMINPTQQTHRNQKNRTEKKANASFYFMMAVLLVSLLAFIYFLWQRRNEKIQLQNLENIRQEWQRKFEETEKQLEARIGKKTVTLQTQLDDLKQKEVALKSELKQAEETNYLKNAFIANMGFDIRTPLGSIIGFANILETELAVRKSKELYNYAANIEKSGYYLLKMLTNIIDLSGLEANTLELKITPVLLDELLKEIEGECTMAAQEKGLIFKVKTDDDLPPVLADKEGLKKVLNQLVDNAIQYTLEGFVTISCTYDDPHDLAVIEVKDTGVGMDKRQKESVSYSLVDRKADTEPSHGSGVGLKLAGKYIAMMNGQMQIASSLEGGTTVTVHMPCSKASEMVVLKEGAKLPEKPDTIVTATLHDLGKLDFFVVEDDRMNRMILEKILSKEGDVTLSSDGDDCLNIVDREAAKKHFFEVMLFDINLPEPWDGVTLMKEIRKKYPPYRKIPFIAQTAYAMAGDKERFLKEGFDSYVSKPIDKNELIGVVRQQLEIFKR